MFASALNPRLRRLWQRRPRDVLDRAGPAQRDESVVACYCVLCAEKAQALHPREVRHPVVPGVHAECAEMRKRDEWLDTGRGDTKAAVVDVEAEEAVETFQPAHAIIREGPAEREMVREHLGTEQRERRLARLPGFQHRKFVQQRDSRVGQGDREFVQMAFARECPERAVTGGGCGQIRPLERMAMCEGTGALVGHAGRGERESSAAAAGWRGRSALHP